MRSWYLRFAVAIAPYVALTYLLAKLWQMAATLVW